MNTVFTCLFSWLSMPLCINIMIFTKVNLKKRFLCLLLGFFVMVTGVIIGENEVGMIWILPIMSIIVYFCYEKKWKNILFVPFSYTLVVLCNYFMDIILLNLLSISSVELLNTQPYALYLTGGTLLLVLLFSFLLHLGIKFLFSYTGKQISFEIFLVLFGNVIICTIIFLINGFAGRRLGYPYYVLLWNFILFGCYAIFTSFVSYFAMKIFQEKEKMRYREDEQQNLFEYTKQVENMYEELRSFKHDYVNILSTISGYLDAQDYQGLENYFSTYILPTNNKIVRDNNQLAKLSNIEHLAVKGILASKFMYAHTLGIHICIDIAEPIKNIPMNPVDFTRILGIYLDNAIEATLDCDEKIIQFHMMNDEHILIVQISNTFQQENLSLSEIEKKGYSSKGNNRGLGLSNANEILSAYHSIWKETRIENGYFTQILTLA